MVVDGSISNQWAVGVGLFGFVVVANYIESWWNPRPPPDRYRVDGQGELFVTGFEFLSPGRYTSDGRRFHRRRLLFTAICLATGAAGWLVLDWAW